LAQGDAEQASCGAVMAEAVTSPLPLARATLAVI
jgi:hypothetical protein